jgi:hypothetical protein
MRIPFVILSTVSLIALGGIAQADDHLVNAEDHGLADKLDGQAVMHSQEAPGQGSPFGGDETHTPSSLVVTGEEENGTFPDAKPHANIKDRTPK